MAKKLYEESSVQAIANAIRGKNGQSTTYKIADMAQAITDIPSGGGGTPSFWAGGLNPQHIQTVTMTHNLSAGTSYNSTTPTTSAKTILTGTQFRETIGPVDMANYDYGLCLDIVTPHTYTETPSVSHMIALGSKIVYFIGRRYNSNATSAKQGVMLTLGAAPIAYYANASQTKYIASSAVYGIGYTANNPAFASSSADSTNLFVYSPSITVRTHSTYMNANAWQYIDAEATNIYIRFQLFRVDKMGICSGAFDMVRNSCLDGDGTMDTNAIIYGGSGS